MSRLRNDRRRARSEPARHLLADHQGSVIGRAFSSGASIAGRFYDQWGVIRQPDS